MIDDISQSIHKVKLSLYEHQIYITECVIQLWNYIFMIVHIRLSLVVEVVLDTQLRPMCKSADDTVPLVMGMVMLFRLTLIRLKSLESQTDQQLRCNEHVVICSLKQWNPSI